MHRQYESCTKCKCNYFTHFVLLWTCNEDFNLQYLCTICHHFRLCYVLKVVLKTYCTWVGDTATLVFPLFRCSAKKIIFCRKATVLILLRVLSIFMVGWISIRWVNHVIDFHPVTFSSGICDVQAALLFPVIFCCLVSTPPRVHALYYDHGKKYDLYNPFRPHDPLFIVISLTLSAHRCKMDTRPLQSHYYTHYNKIRYENKLHFVQYKWLCDLHWLLSNQPFTSRNSKRLYASLEF